MKNKYKLILLISIIIIGAFLLWNFGWMGLIYNGGSTVDWFIYRKFDGQSQSFSIEKVFDNQQDMTFGGRGECEGEFLKRNPTFNDTIEETYYCEVDRTKFYYIDYKTWVDSSGSQYCNCYYKK